MKLAVFIDYDNLLEGQRSAGILDVVTKALFQTPLRHPSARATCDVRLYGGWYEGSTMTQRAQDLVISIAREFPAIIRVSLPGSAIIPIATNAELAVAMLEEPNSHLLDTYRKKGKPSNLRVQKPTMVGCNDMACPLPLAKKLLKNGTCPIDSCAVTAQDLVYRHEQKIVDTMLTCDLIYAPTQNYEHLILVSGDDDFVPPLRTLLLRGIPVARFHPKRRQSRTSLNIRGAQFTDIDL